MDTSELRLALNGVIEADCQTLGAMLRDGSVPKERRAELRALLARAFGALAAEADAAPELLELRTLAQLTDRALAQVRRERAPSGGLWQPIGLRWFHRPPVRVRDAVRHDWLRVLEHRWLSQEARLSAVVEWFWSRCTPNESRVKPITEDERAAKAALEKFGEIDRELVFGRKRRPPSAS